MTINSNWIEKDFKQKYFLYCRDCETKGIIAEKVKQEFAIREKKIKITEI